MTGKSNTGVDDQFAADPVTTTPESDAGYKYLADLHTIKGWLHGMATAPDLADVVADGGVSVGDCYQQEACEFAGRLGRFIEAYRVSRPTSDPVVGVTSGAGERDRLARAIYANRPARMFHPDVRALTWDEAAKDVPDRIATIYRDVDAILSALTPSPPVRLSERERALEDAATRFLAVNDEFERRAGLGVAGHILALAGVTEKPATELRADGQKAMSDLRAALTRTTGEGS